MGNRMFRLCAVAGMVCLLFAVSWGRMSESARTFDPSKYQVSGAIETPFTTTRVHRIGNMAFCVTNYGFFGSQARGIRDACTGISAPSWEFPINSNVEYLFQGALWVGAVVDGDTLVSVGADGWSSSNEMFPRRFPEGDFETRTTRPLLRQPANSLCPDVQFSADAISEQDFIAVYSDTLGVALGTGGGQTAGHRPMGLEITQKTYSWSFDYAQDFILMEMNLANVGDDTLKDLYMGIYMDHDVGSTSAGAIHEDDVTGFTHWVPSPAAPDLYRDTVNLAWIADNDGDPRNGEYYFASVTGISGVRVVQSPDNAQFSFNWWVSNGNAARDWGPNKDDSDVRFLGGNLGTPTGDIAKYATMANGEFDYPQWESAIDHSVDHWLPPVQNGPLAIDLANGFDTRYLLSFGPFDVVPDSVLPLTIALITGEDFHTDPRNFNAFFDPFDPAPWLDNLSLDDFALNALWAGWVYDTPGFDTDGDGFAGNFRVIGIDTAYYTGDGVPDYQGPPPPPPPSDISHKTIEGKIVIRWNGENTETDKDPFSFLEDFEGYRVYMSRTLQLGDFALVTQRDNINFTRRKYKAANGRWLITDTPFTLDSLKALYDPLSDSLHGYLFHPDSFKIALRSEALIEVELDDLDPSKLDTNYYYFERFDSNEKVNDTLTAYLADTLGHDVTGVIRKVYPYAGINDTLFRDESGEPFRPFYEYEYAVDGLQLAEPVFLAVTAFDFGNPAADLSSLESSPLASSVEVWPINSAEVVKLDRPKPGVYPNPYRLADDYNGAGWENPRNLQPDPNRARKVTFTNVPDTCTVTVWSLDGDLVRKFDHAEPPGNSDASVVVWNLITRNTQAVKTGIYIYTVESRLGTDIGKLVIIK
jgi:hypothetical protein